MKALLIKDLLTSKGLLKNYLLVVLIYAFVAYTNQNVFLFSGMLLMIPVLMVLNAVGYDEKAGTLRLMIASGLSRKQLAYSKYVFGAVLMGVVFVINFVVVSVVEDVVSALITSCLFYIVGMGYLSLLMPFLYKFGTEKSRIYMMLGAIVPMAAGAAVTKAFQLFSIQLSETTLLLLIAVLCFAIIAGSLKISAEILSQKDM